jgi:hypothetical protein
MRFILLLTTKKRKMQQMDLPHKRLQDGTHRNNGMLWGRSRQAALTGVDDPHFPVQMHHFHPSLFCFKSKCSFGKKKFRNSTHSNNHRHNSLFFLVRVVVCIASLSSLPHHRLASRRIQLFFIYI